LVVNTNCVQCVESGRDQWVPAFLFQHGGEKEFCGVRNDPSAPGIVFAGFSRSGKSRMATIAYKVTRDGDQWSLSRDGKPAGMNYFTQEAAFEVAVGEADGDLRSGHGIVIQVSPATDPAGPGDRGGEPVEGDGFSS
jgi:hypothetical protein